MENREIRVAMCGSLPTAYNFLLKQGVVQIDQYEYATEIVDESAYHLILIYAPGGEGILDTVTSGGRHREDLMPQSPFGC